MELLADILFVLSGALVHIYMKYLDSKTKKIKFEIKAHVYATLITFAAGAIFAIAMHLKGKELSMEMAITLGYSIDSIFKNVENKWNNKSVSLQ